MSIATFTSAAGDPMITLVYIAAFLSVMSVVAIYTLLHWHQKAMDAHQQAIKAYIAALDALMNDKDQP